MSLRSAYRTGAVWAMNRFTLATAMKLKDSEGNYIWQPTWNLTRRAIRHYLWYSCCT